MAQELCAGVIPIVVANTVAIKILNGLIGAIYFLKSYLHSCNLIYFNNKQIYIYEAHFLLSINVATLATDSTDDLNCSWRWK